MTSAPLDLTRLVERLAGELAEAHASHPVAAAVALACRGRTGLDVAEFARRIGLDPATVRACESGDVPFGELPTQITPGDQGLDLLSLADLDRHFRYGEASDRGPNSCGTRGERVSN